MIKLKKLKNHPTFTILEVKKEYTKKVLNFLTKAKIPKKIPSHLKIVKAGNEFSQFLICCIDGNSLKEEKARNKVIDFLLKNSIFYFRFENIGIIKHNNIVREEENKPEEKWPVKKQVQKKNKRASFDAKCLSLLNSRGFLKKFKEIESKVNFALLITQEGKIVLEKVKEESNDPNEDVVIELINSFYCDIFLGGGKYSLNDLIVITGKEPTPLTKIIAERLRVKRLFVFEKDEGDFSKGDELRFRKTISEHLGSIVEVNNSP